MNREQFQEALQAIIDNLLRLPREADFPISRDLSLTLHAARVSLNDALAIVKEEAPK